MTSLHNRSSTTRAAFCSAPRAEYIRFSLTSPRLRKAFKSAALLGKFRWGFPLTGLQPGSNNRWIVELFCGGLNLGDLAATESTTFAHRTPPGAPRCIAKTGFMGMPYRPSTWVCTRDLLKLSPLFANFLDCFRVAEISGAYLFVSWTLSHFRLSI